MYADGHMQIPQVQTKTNIYSSLATGMDIDTNVKCVVALARQEISRMAETHFNVDAVSVSLYIEIDDTDNHVVVTRLATRPCNATVEALVCMSFIRLLSSAEEKLNEFEGSPRLEIDDPVSTTMWKTCSDAGMFCKCGGGRTNTDSVYMGHDEVVHEPQCRSDVWVMQ